LIDLYKTGRSIVRVN